MPWRLESALNRFARYQQVHRQIVHVGLVTPLCGEYDFGEYPETLHGMQMREMVHLSALLRDDIGDADFLVVHHHPPGSPWPDMQRCLPLIAAKFGEPVYRDDEISVYPLAQVSPLGNNRRPMQQ